MSNYLTREFLGVFRKSAEWSPLLTTWIDQYEKRLITIAYSVIHDNQLALDCVQEAFIKAGLNADKLQRSDRVFPWLSRIVVNECISKSRRNKRETVTDAIEQHGYLETYSFEQESELFQMVGRLPDKLRLPVVLHYYNDLSLAEVACILRLNETTCRVRLHRARTKLREMMEGDLSDQRTNRRNAQK